MKRAINKEEMLYEKSAYFDANDCVHDECFRM